MGHRAAAEPPAVVNVERCRNRLAIAHGDNQYEVLGHAAAECPEKIEIEIRRRVMLPVSLAVAAVKKYPPCIGDGRSGKPLERNPGIADAAPLLLDLLAFVVIESGKKPIEVSVVVIAPVKLHAMTEHESAFA